MPSQKRPKRRPKRSGIRSKGFRQSDFKPVSDIFKKGVKHGSTALEYVAKQAEPYLKQGADMDILIGYNGLLMDVRSFFLKYGIKSVIADDIFYTSISDLLKLYKVDINR